MFQCANCPTYVCRAGDWEHGPEYCPMHGDFPSTDILYSEPTDRDLARLAAVIEGTGYRRWTRAEEIMELAHGLGVSRLGLTFCAGMRREAEIYLDVLQANGFQVVLGALGSPQQEELRLEEASDGCNPVAQAQLCNERQTGLNILLGLCVGHDSLFIRNSQGLVTCLVVKDRVLAHNPVAALYQVNSYFQTTLYQHHRHDTQPPNCLEPESLRWLEQAYTDPDMRRLAIAAGSGSQFQAPAVVTSRGDHGAGAKLKGNPTGFGILCRTPRRGQGHGPYSREEWLRGCLCWLQDGGGA